MEIPEIKGAIEGAPYARPVKKKPGFVEVERVARSKRPDEVSEEREEGHHPPTEQFHPETKGKGDKNKKAPGHVDIKI